MRRDDEFYRGVVWAALCDAMREQTAAAKAAYEADQEHISKGRELHAKERWVADLRAALEALLNGRGDPGEVDGMLIVQRQGAGRPDPIKIPIPKGS